MILATEQARANEASTIFGVQKIESLDIRYYQYDTKGFDGASFYK